MQVVNRRDLSESESNTIRVGRLRRSNARDPFPNAEQTLDAFVKIGVLEEERRNDNRAIEAAISALCQRGYRAIKAERENRSR